MEESERGKMLRRSYLGRTREIRKKIQFSQNTFSLEYPKTELTLLILLYRASI